MIAVVSFARTVACSKLQDSGEKSFSKKVKNKGEKRAGGFAKSRASYFRSARFNTIWEPGTGYAKCDVASILPRKLIPGRAEYLNLENRV